MQFWIFNLSANPDILCVYIAHNFPLNLRNFGYSISSPNQTFRTYAHNYQLNLHSNGFSIYLQIMTIRTFNVHNYPLNLRSSGFSIYLQIQTVRTFNVEFKLFWISNLSANPDIPYV